MQAKDIAQALERCDWSGIHIGNKAIVKAAIDELQRLYDLNMEMLEALDTIGAHTITDQDGDELEVLYGDFEAVAAAIARNHEGRA